MLDAPAAKTGWGIARFVKFCRTYKIVGWLVGDPSFVDMEEMISLPNNATGPMGLLSHKYVILIVFA